MTRYAWLSNDYAELDGVTHPGGCTYYRQMLPANAFPGSMLGRPAWTGEHGFGVVKGHQAVFGFDVVVLKQIMSRPSPFQVQAAQRLGQYVIVDVDDFYPGLDESNRAWDSLDPARNKMQNVELHERVVQLADMVTVSTPFLFDYYSERRDNVHLVRNGVNPKQFVAHEQRDKPVLGWVGATGWRSGDVESLREWLPDFLAEHDLMFQHSGHLPGEKPFHELAGIPVERMLWLPMVPVPLYAGLFTMDIGLVPLRLTPFNQAKSCLKGLEYAAAGIPFVASITSEYVWLSPDVGRIAFTTDDWVRQVGNLLSVDRRRMEAKRQREHVMKHHTIMQRAYDWIDVFKPLIGHRSKAGQAVVEWREL